MDPLPTFAPIAIVGRACTLPGALSPEELWAAVVAGRDLLSAVPAGRWRVEPDQIMCDPSAPQADRTWSDRGGYVEGFDERFDPEGFGLPPGEISRLDPVFRWTLHTARAALRDAGLAEGARVGAVLGNLSFPSVALARFAESVWWGESVDDPPIDPRNRFGSGLPALLLAQALGLEAGAFALDAACASSLYAVKYACDWLHDGRADLVLAGAVNGADDLFIHVGFSSLAALSRTGQSRPFHADADGLVPAEGAAFVALKRLEDAERDNDRIHGVIRGIGLSNDGRGRGFLVPSTEGQVRAMRAAYDESGVIPGDISLLECHATGTQIGDATELESVAEVFDQEIPVGSLKSNLGHLITVAGVAGLIKVTEAMRAGIRPATLHVGRPLDSAGASSARLLTEAEPWQVDGVRRAAVSAFGFGGNNAHLVVEEHTPDRAVAALTPPFDDEIAVVGVGVITAGCPDRPAFTSALLDGVAGPADKSIESFEVDIARLAMPPKDLEHTLAQQLLMLEAGYQAAAEVDGLPRDRTGVFVGMGVDAEVARYGARWRSRDQTNRDGVIGPLDSAGVIGTMPNIVANRLNRLLDVAGPSCTVSAEELSGLEALALAVRALRHGELDAAVVGAVDLSCEPVHAAAALAVLPADRHTPGDAAVALVVKRLSDAEAAGDHVYATVRSGSTGQATLVEWGPGSDHDLTRRFGHAHCASGLLHLVGAVVAIDAGRLPDGVPWLSEGLRRAEVHIDPMLGVASAAGTWTVTAHGDPHSSDDLLPIFHVYEGADAHEVVAALESDRRAEGWRSRPASGARLVIVARDAETLAARIERARQHILIGTPPGDGVHYREAPTVGEIGFVFASAGTAYEGMGIELVRSFPDVADAVQERFGDLLRALGWALASASPTNAQRLWGASAISRMHAELTTRFLGIEPQAAIGYSSGESTALFALGAWTDLDAMREQIESEGLFDPELGGTFDAVARAWGETGPVGWAAWNVLADVEEVRSLVANEKRLHLAIVHTATNSVIAGDALAARRVVELIGTARCHELEYNIAAHVPEVQAFGEAWLDIHRRPVTPVPGVRFYSTGYGRSYELSPDECSRAIFAQATDTLDFPMVINQAWDDGVRIFIEHGPQGVCSGWIREILGDRQAEVVALDRKGRGTDQTLDAVGALLAAGVAVDTGWLEQRLGRRAPVRVESETRIRLPGHPKPVRSPRPGVIGVVAEIMEPAPMLPSVTDLWQTSPPPASSGRVNAGVIEPREAAASASHPGTMGVAPDDLSNAVGWQSGLALIGQVHQQFLAQQSAVHQRFLATRAISADVAGLPGPVPGAADVDPDLIVAPSPEPRRPEPAPIPEHVVGRLPGLVLDRAQVEIHASGTISEIFGPGFVEQDSYLRQVRMPEPPLLLVDRVTGIDGEPGVHGTGTIWTETDVRDDSWYLHAGRMPAGILIESGQADLMLISYMGTDLLNKGDRVYRLLGCQLTFQDDLPVPGDTLSYEIHIDGHANQDEVRLFFFHYDCTVDGRPRIKVRDGQAGFFTDEELAHSGGVLWSAEESEPCADPRLDPPVVVGARTSFDVEAVRAFAGGRLWDCFGPEFDLPKTHTRTPVIQSGDMLLFDTVTDFDSTGGPWGRGYLRAESAIASDDWFFAGHFKNDPCMPGTLMFEGCLQTLSFMMAGMGFTLHRDGWRFQPVTGQPIEMVCRGQVTPSSRTVVYEVFVEEIIAGPRPTIYADLLCTVDGQKAFLARRVGLELVPDWPFDGRGGVDRDEHPVAGVSTPDGDFKFGYPSLLACALGKPSDAFGPMYARFDGPGRVPRLPGPPYHFISRVTGVTGPIGGMEVGSTVEVEYDIPEDAWYFADNGTRSMPFAVLLEAALQPCGWLASYIGSALTTDSELAFRNLDGAGTVHEELFDDTGTLSTHVELKAISRTAGMIIVNFAVACTVAGRLVYDLTTVFGFFPPDVLANQVGLPVDDVQRLELTEPGDRMVDLGGEPTAYFGATLGLATGRLRMLDRVTGFWPRGGSHGLGRLRAERRIDVGDWYFKAHFFQDPVQPGSLGIEMMLQLLQFYLIESGAAGTVVDPRFEPIAKAAAMSWKYRGQVVPSNDLVQVTMDITDLVDESGAVLATATASLWCDGIRIYSADNLAIRVVSGSPRVEGGVVLDPTVDTWLGDHRPTWNRPALPMMSIVDRLADAVVGQVVGVRELGVDGWVDFDGPRHLRTDVEQLGDGEFLVRLTSGGARLASAIVTAGEYPNPPEPFDVIEGVAMDDPYLSGRLFHGPAFRLQTEGTLGADGASTLLDAGRGQVPIGRLHPGLLDAALHGIPHDRLHQWATEISDDQVAFPVRIVDLALYGPTPTRGLVRCEVRFDGFLARPDLPRFRVQLIAGGQVWAGFTIVEACLPKGPIGSAEPGPRRSFLADHTYVPGLSLSEQAGGDTRLDPAIVAATDWMPGTVPGIFGTNDLEAIAVKEHLAHRSQLHPFVLPAALPLHAPVQVRHEGNQIVVRSPDVRLDIERIDEYWADRLGIDHWLGNDLTGGLVNTYVRDVVLEDPVGFGRIRSGGAIFVANHQVQVESILVTHLLPVLLGHDVVTMANAKHANRWVGWLIDRLRTYPGVASFDPIVYFDQAMPDSMGGILAGLRGGLTEGRQSLFVHAQGTRSLLAPDPVTRLSSVFVDLAVECRVPIVPVKFRGGLAAQPRQSKLEMPLGSQDYVVGSPIWPDELESLPYADRRSRVLAAINAIDDRPIVSPIDEAFLADVESWSGSTGARPVESTFMRILETIGDPSIDTQRLVEGAHSGELLIGSNPVDTWLGEVAGVLYGPTGPRVRRG